MKRFKQIRVKLWRWVVFTALFMCATIPVTSLATDTNIITGARNVFQRVINTSLTNSISLSVIPQVGGRDVYEYEATGGILTVRGSSTVAMCRGTYDYLRANNLGTVGWAGPRLNLPTQWPDATLTQGETPFKIRHCYNIVTAGYTFPYWTWDRWQQELDWLAMHGYNMIMAPVATEAILTRVWEDLGLTQTEIDQYFTGPAHLPWNRMGNIRQVGGTMTAAWNADQIALQTQLLARMSELGIEPVVQGFAGFVPPGIARIYPDVTLHNTLWNSGFPTSQRPVSIMPDEPLFADIMNRYITEWKNQFGDARYFLVDSFNEMQLPAGDPETLLAGYGRDTYSALIAADSDAIWVLQGWMFYYQRDIWNPGTVQALMDSVPDERLLVLDYANDYNPNWDDFSSFHGKTWVMGYVPNMGGKTAYTGKMGFYANQVAYTLQDPGNTNLVGFTISGEGLENNETLYELMSDTAWSSSAIDLNQWLPNYAKNRYGTTSFALSSAWEQLRSSVYSHFTDHPTFGWQKLSLKKGTVYSGIGFIQAVDTFLSVADTMGTNPNYRDDAIEMTALALGLRAEEWFSLANSAYSAGNPTLSKTYGDKALALLLQADRLLESHSFHRLDRWIDMARSHNGTPAEKDEYERNARQIVTVWGPPVNDYSCRVWSGLIRDFYAPRMEAMLDAMLAGQSFSRTTWEAAWVNASGVSSVTPYTDPAAKAKELFEAAYAEVLENLPSLDLLIGRWYPDQMSETWVTLEWNFPADKLSELEGVTFTFTGGSHRFEINKAAIIADGTEVVADAHFGYTGDTHVDNFYALEVPKGTQANNSCILRATVRSAGGTDSSGMINMQLKVTAPSFTANQLNDSASITEDHTLYSYSLSGDVELGSDGPWTFSRVSGAEWMKVTTAGTVFGYPTSADLGTNSIIIRVSDYSGDWDETTFNATLSTVDLSGGLTSWWSFDEGSGTTAVDNSGSGHNGTLMNGATWSAGVSASALELDGNNDYVDTGSRLVSQQLTLAAWINPDVLSVSPFDRSIISQDGVFTFKTSSSGFRFTTPGILDHTTPNVGLVINQWQHVAVTFSAGVTGGAKFYLNGELVSTLNASSMASATSPIWIGKNQWGQYFNGTIDDVRIYNRILDADEIAQLAAGSANTPPTAVNDTLSAYRDAANTLDVLANDSDPDIGDTLGVMIVTQGENGSVFNNLNHIIYTPNSGFIGTDSFSYVVNDGSGNTNMATVNVSVNIYPPLDADSDGMSDAWETQFFVIDGTATLPTDDPDSDTYNNLEEFIAGTNPNNPQSKLEITRFAAQVGATGNTIEWMPVGGRYYRVNWAPTLTNNYSKVVDFLEYPIGSYTCTNHVGEAQGFYKLDVRLK